MPVTELKAGITVWNSMASNGQSIQPRWSNSTSSQSPSRKWDRNALPFCKASLLKLLKPFANTIWFSLTVSRQSGREHLTWRWGAVQPTSLATAPSTFPSLRWSLLDSKKHLFGDFPPTTDLSRPCSAPVNWQDYRTAVQLAPCLCSDCTPRCLTAFLTERQTCQRCSASNLSACRPGGCKFKPCWRIRKPTRTKVDTPQHKGGKWGIQIRCFFFFFLPSSMTHIGFKNSPLVKSLTGVHCTNVLIHAEFGPKFHSQSTAPRNGHFIPVFLSPPQKLCI